jgi:hypothetical protein
MKDNRPLRHKQMSDHWDDLEYVDHDLGARTLADAARVLAKHQAKIEDSAVAEYVRAQCQWLAGLGEPLEQYQLVRESTVDLSGMKTTWKLVYVKGENDD